MPAKLNDKDFLRIVTDFSNEIILGNPSMKCFMVTAPLSTYLSMCGIENELIQGEVETPTGLWEHFWIKLNDGRIIDPTAGQFEELKLPTIYFGDLPKQYSYDK